ncbi:MAG: shikimate dehydrogenase [Desulfobacca sp.]|nr:shikimate dehydrogenase [Desulfobacca sp.]
MADSPLNIFAVFGNPIAHSLSPLMHQAALDRMNLKARYVPFCVHDLKGAVQGIRGLDIRGVSVTLPFKSDIIEYLDELEESARKIGAVNTIWNHQRKLKGYNTDWIGIVQALQEVMEIRGKRFAVLGAGGAARGVLYGLIRAGGHPIILNRTRSQAEALAKSFDCPYQPFSEKEKIEADCLINTTSLGMTPDIGASPLSRKHLKKFFWVIDIIYNPLKTKLLREAEEAGCQTLSGVGMFVHQGAEQIKIWTGLEPPRTYMREVVLAELEKK